MGSVFINYRRGETAGEARALFNELVTMLGKDSVFMDVDNIALGRDFREVLQERLASCDLMLALIGKDWVYGKNSTGQRQIDIPGDFVRLEIEAALMRNITVTPVLVQGAQMPSAEQLPDSIKDFAYRNGFELSHNRWESDVQEMLKRLRLNRQQDSGAVGRLWFTIVALVTAAIAGGGLLLYQVCFLDQNCKLFPNSADRVLISSDGVNRSPQYSPDNAKIAFQSNRSGSSQIWICDADGSNPVQLTDIKNSPIVGSPRWSFDGSRIAFDVRLEGNSDIWWIPASGGIPTRLTKDPYDQVRPSWSHDGKWIYYGSDQADRKWEIWKLPIAGGPAIRITQGGGREAFEAADGRSVFYAKAEQNGIWRVPTDGGEEIAVTDGGRQGMWAVLPGDRLLLTAGGRNQDESHSEVVLERFDLAIRRRGTMKTLHLPEKMALIDIGASPSLDVLAYTAGDNEQSIIFQTNIR